MVQKHKNETVWFFILLHKRKGKENAASKQIMLIKCHSTYTYKHIHLGTIVTYFDFIILSLRTIPHKAVRARQIFCLFPPPPPQMLFKQAHMHNGGTYLVA